MLVNFIHNYCEIQIRFKSHSHFKREVTFMGIIILNCILHVFYVTVNIIVH